jgi:hypothetical protein
MTSSGILRNGKSRPLLLLGRSTDWHRDCFISEDAPKRCAEVFVFGAFQTNIVHPDG